MQDILSKEWAICAHKADKCQISSHESVQTEAWDVPSESNSASYHKATEQLSKRAEQMYSLLQQPKAVVAYV